MTPGDSESQFSTAKAHATETLPSDGRILAPPAPPSEPTEGGFLLRAFVGPNGLRAGWSVLITVTLYRLFYTVLGTITVTVFPAIGKADDTPGTVMIGEWIVLLAMLAAGLLVARIEQRGMLDYNLTGTRRPTHFFAGAAAGFAALSLLVGALAWGGWLHLGAATLSSPEMVRFGAVWAVAFLCVGCVEEGIFRCYLQFTLTRGINFWWALVTVTIACLDLLLRSKGLVGVVAFLWLEPLSTIKGNCVWGVYLAALIGLGPCLVLHLRKAESAGFWQAAWVGSALFGFIHTGNGGENWIGIFAAALIGFVFVVSVRVTGSAWWAIGCHAAWDWTETYFYGTADSGMVATGHLFTSTPVGKELWSGGTDGPEGSVLVIAVVLLLLVAVLAIYGRKTAAIPLKPAAD